MQKIQRLTDHASKRIKAQQYVPDHYVVAKELIENSIDSGATHIKVTFEDFITVEDNGCGIDDLDAVAIEGSTSKELMSYYVLGCVQTTERFFYGFRGQALWSIASMSDLEITSRSTKPFAIHKCFNTNTTSKCARERGTTVEVKNLFKNNPVRRVASRNSIRACLSRICSLMENYSCVNNVEFTLFHNRKVLMSLKGCGAPRKYFESQYMQYAGRYMEICTNTFDMIMLPVAVKNLKQMIFLGKRPVENKRILNAIKKEFGLYFDGNPAFVLVIKCSGDVNVAVDKSEVILEDEVGIISLLRSEISRFFSTSIVVVSAKGVASSMDRSMADKSVIKNLEQVIWKARSISDVYSDYEVSGKKDTCSVISEPSTAKNTCNTSEVDGINNISNKKAGKDDLEFMNLPETAIYSYQDDKDTSETHKVSIPDKCINVNKSERYDNQYYPEYTSVNQSSFSSDLSINTYESERLSTKAYMLFKHDEVMQPKLCFLKEDFNKLEVIGQFNNGFIIAKLNKDERTYLVAVDQHAADEISNYERIKASFTLKTQKLLVPIDLHLNALDNMVVNENLDILAKNGFIISDGVLQAAPAYKNEVFGVDELSRFVEDIKCGEYEFWKVREIVASKACRTSVMIGRTLSASDMKRVVSNLACLERPWKCPHGRPTFMILNECLDI
ncbi:putative DNA mismatch repair enzyme [Ordospora colligata OC4]|uniref:Putative DNA mismatch repair enzyme n=1 Tax=Ordospora colligata OC4 TaxID=1354746 RepID=A0A0B2UCW7_9MICR|nr:putative DNA mismatch repair enzyme [Ordospora colligata OC4]KHN68891.1 putative DNA mismatch repair enzyme [Ordospora colligata OC4]TBU13925.1 putative DNA mismatch repair enzyme [Ordospora colligata]TBU14114.1 putative DNA mismatch repair enzyme [Ordospora colligata]